MRQNDELKKLQEMLEKNLAILYEYEVSDDQIRICINRIVKYCGLANEAKCPDSTISNIKQMLSTFIILRKYVYTAAETSELQVEKYRFCSDCVELINKIINDLYTLYMHNNDLGNEFDIKTQKAFAYLKENLFEVPEQVDPPRVSAADTDPSGIKPETWSSFWKASAVAGTMTAVAGTGFGVYELHEHASDGALHVIEGASETL